MTDKDKINAIKEEIENLIKRIALKDETDSNLEAVHGGQIYILGKVLRFIDSHSEEPVSEDLEEAAKRYFDKIVEETKCHFNHYMTYAQGFEDGRLRVKDAFKAGANWHKNQMVDVLRTEYEKGKHEANEQMIDKACEWLERNVPYGVVSRKRIWDMVQDFRKAMEDEK